MNQVAHIEEHSGDEQVRHATAAGSAEEDAAVPIPSRSQLLQALAAPPAPVANANAVATSSGSSKTATSIKDAPMTRMRRTVKGNVTEYFARNQTNVSRSTYAATMTAAAGPCAAVTTHGDESSRRVPNFPPPEARTEAVINRSGAEASDKPICQFTLPEGSWTRRLAVGRTWQPAQCQACEIGTSARCKMCSRPLCIPCAKRQALCLSEPRSCSV